MNFTTVKKHLEQDPVLFPLVQRMTLRPLSGERDVYAALLRSIISQQLSVKAADTIYKRFLNLFPKGQPSPKQLLNKTEEALRSAGLSKQKAKYVQYVAQAAIDGQWSKKDWAVMSDEEVSTYLCQIKGVGPWTAQMILLFCLHRPDVFPIKDLVIYQTIVELYDLNPKHKTLMKKIDAIAEQWRPYRSHACRYIWAYRDKE